MGEIQKNGAEIFQYLEENFTKNGFVQYRIQDIEHKFSGKELEALTKLFDFFQPGDGTQPQLPAVMSPDDKEYAIAYLDKYLGEFMSEELAKKAYAAYGKTTDFKNYQGLPMHEWENLPENIQKAWCNAASAIAEQATLDLHKLAIPRCTWEVVAGVIPGYPDPKLTKRFVLNQAEWESEESASIFTQRMDGAYSYARSLNSPANFNWVNVSWIWY